MAREVPDATRPIHFITNNSFTPMETLRPRNVGPNAWKRWLREALALTRRNLFSNILSGLAGVGLFVAIVLLDNVSLSALILLVFPPFALVWYLRTAYYGDRSMSVFVRSRGSTQRPWTIALATVTPYVVLFTFFCIIALFGHSVIYVFELFGLIETPAKVHPLATAQVPPGTVGSASLMLGLAILIPTIVWLFSTAMFVYWFVLPLTLFHDCSLLVAWRLSVDADLVNDGFVFNFVGAVIFALMVLVALTGIIAFVVALPILGALLYVSYRDVFLGRADNLPMVNSHAYERSQESIVFSGSMTHKTRFKTMRRFHSLLTVAFFCFFTLMFGCAAQNTNWAPVVDPYNNPNADRISADQYECRQLATQASGNTATKTGKGALIGGALGAATGAALGAVSGDAGKGAAYGAALGGVGGAAHQGVGSNEQYKSAYRSCMRGRGHNVLN